jgi:hypothetical protein
MRLEGMAPSWEGVPVKSPAQRIVLVLVLVGACSGGKSESVSSTAATLVTSSVLPPTTTTASPTPTPSPTPAFSDADRLLVEDAARDFLTAFSRNDLKGFRDRKALSTGDLARWMEWVLAEPPSQSASTDGDLTIDTLQVQSGSAEAATVDVDATLVYTDAEYHVTGPMLFEKTAKGWKVADYVRDGRSQVEAIFADPSGTQESNGVSMKVIGVVLQANYIDVYVKVTNSTASSLGLYGDVSLVDSKGNQFANGALGVGGLSELAGHASLTVDSSGQIKSCP